MWIMGARPVQKTVPFACHASGGTTVLHLRRIFRACLPWVLGAAVVVVVSACCENRAVIRDLRHFPQDAFRYFDQSQGNRLLLSDGAQSVLDQQFNRHFFSPCHLRTSAMSVTALSRRKSWFRIILTVQPVSIA